MADDIGAMQQSLQVTAQLLYIERRLAAEQEWITHMRTTYDDLLRKNPYQHATQVAQLAQLVRAPPPTDPLSALEAVLPHTPTAAQLRDLEARFAEYQGRFARLRNMFPPAPTVQDP